MGGCERGHGAEGEGLLIGWRGGLTSCKEALWRGCGGCGAERGGCGASGGGCGCHAM